MDLPVMPPVKPMLAKSVPVLPRGDGLAYEPKWDGFRCIVFRDGDEVELGSRNDKPLTRYFPEVVELLREALPPRCVVDGEIVLVTPDGLSFDTLQLRLHPAASRVRKLSVETPASFVAFDLLACGSEDVTGLSLRERRKLLEEIVTEVPGIYLTPSTADPDVAQDWFTRFEGAGFDGVMVKALDGVYEPDKRVMFKVKHERTADCVVAGYRWHKDGETVGSLVLGLYQDGELHNVGVASSFTAARRRELVEELKPLLDPAEHPWSAWATYEGPGMNSRWNPEKQLQVVLLEPTRVAEVRYEHVQGGRFRHTSRLVRFREDKTALECTYEQLEEVPPAELDALFGEAEQRRRTIEP
ncbi:ATP-dependent DNA ligase [Lentzea sp. NBC_00516]|uniref:ATP-dependent DNA ligase n=1 Tax=Lentzea sp. NBC_00516 TaxID=2903582 RepID=UPI002E7FF687|nr:ATP-dependent DNA ligase [Lentzea sp. NBC_00516]WUD29039.1 ATP-dependent DNA ligase [Lentzea sp. NBC_00516]